MEIPLLLLYQVCMCNIIIAACIFIKLLWASVYVCMHVTITNLRKFTIHYVGIVYLFTLHALQTGAEGQPLPSPLGCMVCVCSSKAT